MAETATQDHVAGSVEALLSYMVDTGVKPVNETKGPGGLTRIHTGKLEEHAVTIRDGRALKSEFGLEKHGFEFIDHETAAKNFFDVDELKAVYYPEIEQLVKQHTGAARVLIFDHTLRSGDENTRQAKLIREPVKSVHNDYTEDSGPQRVRDLLPEEADELLAHRFAVINVWKPIHVPVFQAPLAVCDAQSIAAEDMIETDLRYPDRTGEIYSFSYSPLHRWLYFPDMHPEETLLIKCYDSEEGRARFTAHSAIDDPGTPEGALPRQSIEVRTFAFFGPAV